MKISEILTEGLMGHFEDTMERVNSVLAQLKGKVPPEKHQRYVNAINTMSRQFHELYHSGREDDAEGMIDSLQSAERQLSKMMPQRECEVIYVSEEGQILTEAAQRTFKREGKKIVRKYRCTTGMKEGKIVADPKSCATRKDPAKVRHGKKVARSKKGIRVRKTKIAKRSSASKMVTRMNARLKATKNKK